MTLKSIQSHLFFSPLAQKVQTNSQIGWFGYCCYCNRNLFRFVLVSKRSPLVPLFYTPFSVLLVFFFGMADFLFSSKTFSSVTRAYLVCVSFNVGWAILPWNSSSVMLAAQLSRTRVWRYWESLILFFFSLVSLLLTILAMWDLLCVMCLNSWKLVVMDSNDWLGISHFIIMICLVRNSIFTS